MVNQLLSDPMKSILAAASNKATAGSVAATVANVLPSMASSGKQQKQQPSTTTVTSDDDDDGDCGNNNSNNTHDSGEISVSRRTPSPSVPASSPITSTTSSNGGVAPASTDNNNSTKQCNNGSKGKGKGPCGYIPPPPPPKIEPGSYTCQEPSDNDVLYGRGSRVNNHKGNVEFRQLVGQFKDMYLDSSRRKIEKAHICAYVVSLVRELRHGHFLTYCPSTQTWEEVGDIKARKKAGQALREDATELRAAEAGQQTMLKQDPQEQDKMSADVERKGSPKPLTSRSAMDAEEKTSSVAVTKKNKKKTFAAASGRSDSGGGGGPTPAVTPSAPPDIDNDLLMEDMLLRASVDSFRVSLEEGNVCSDIDFAQFMTETDRKEMIDQQHRKKNSARTGATSSRKRRNGDPVLENDNDQGSDESDVHEMLNNSNNTLPTSNLHDSIIGIGTDPMGTTPSDGCGGRNVHSVSLLSNKSSTTTSSSGLISGALAAAVEQEEQRRHLQQQLLSQQQPGQARVSLSLEESHHKLQQQLLQQQEHLNALCAAAAAERARSHHAADVTASSSTGTFPDNNNHREQNYPLHLATGSDDPLEPSPLPDGFSPALYQALAQQQQHQQQRLERDISGATGMSVGDSFTMKLLRDSMGSFNPSSYGNHHNYPNFLLSSNNNNNNSFMSTNNNNNNSIRASMSGDSGMGSSIDFARFLSEKDKAEMLMNYGGDDSGRATTNNTDCVTTDLPQDHMMFGAAASSSNSMKDPFGSGSSYNAVTHRAQLSEQEAAAASEAFQAARLRLRLGAASAAHHHLDTQTETIDEIMSSQMSVVSLNETNNDNVNNNNNNRGNNDSTNNFGGGLGGSSNVLRDSLGMATMMADSIRSTTDHSTGTAANDFNRFSFSRYA